MARRRVLAIASGGGHWMQLTLLGPAFDGHDVTWATTLPGLAAQAGLAPAHVIPDCNRDTPLRIAACTAVLAALLARLRPQVVLSTGALPGVIAMGLARAMGARTIWVDSIANAEEMSASGRLARRVATHRLSQWPDVARAEGAEHAGSVL
ncbi:MAG: UDP-N-acetylglucosamine--LPS N-acetylglucosamine transferase [Pseudomonadota bacterium]